MRSSWLKFPGQKRGGRQTWGASGGSPTHIKQTKPKSLVGGGKGGDVVRERQNSVWETSPQEKPNAC